MDIAAFSLANQANHINVGNAIFAKFKIQIEGYVLDPPPAADWTGWLLNHQASHNQINGILGVAGNDLTILDLKDRDAVENWIFLHASEHRLWQLKLGSAALG